MVIYGLTIMGLCMLVGCMLGQGLGYMLGISANVGGVGFAMLFLVLATRRLMDKGQLSKLAESGIQFWNAMYIPVVIAMAAKQNVVAAASGGAVALIAGLAAVFAGFLLIRPLSSLADTGQSEEETAETVA